MIIKPSTAVRDLGTRLVALFPDKATWLSDFKWKAWFAGHCTGDPCKRGVDLSTGEVLGAWPGPVSLPVWGRPTSRNEPPCFGVLRVRCRHCAWCLRFKAAMITQAARREVAASERTFFVTLTASTNTVHRILDRMLREKIRNLAALPPPQEHESPIVSAKQRSMYAAVQELADWVAAGSQTTAVASLSGRAGRVLRAFREQIFHQEQVAPFLKRLRANSGARVRHLAVTELHQSGYPHVHMLVHEVPGEGSVSKRLIEGAYRGRAKARLVRGDRDIKYVTKYLAKDGSTPRTSRGYGGSQAPCSLVSTTLAPTDPGLPPAGVVREENKVFHNERQVNDPPHSLEAPNQGDDLSNGDPQGAFDFGRSGLTDLEAASAASSANAPSRELTFSKRAEFRWEDVELKASGRSRGRAPPTKH